MGWKQASIFQAYTWSSTRWSIVPLSLHSLHGKALDWKLIFLSQELTTPQVFLKVKSTTLPLFLEFTSQLLLESTWVSKKLQGRPKRSDFNFIIDKMQTPLAAWKNRLLNRTCRLTLASSVLSSIPTYYMQINWLSQNICDSIDQTTGNFFRKGTNNTWIHLVNWKKVTSQKHNGGLGIRIAREANTCLLGKLV